ncbi:MAG: DUF447 family protein [Gammaproteobacteria bacterium]|nr:DUF447 family protein [Gammaproteobacteria bacterium]MCI0590053.1 DUF447 family protein [Gammaproteobacteria bacterium]
MIYETIITTRGQDGAIHMAPMGIREVEKHIVIAPFKPSATLDNLRRTGQAVINMIDDVSIVAGCLTGRRNWPTVPAEVVDGERLAAALAHTEVEVSHIEENEQRPRFYCSVRHQQTHAPFKGFNRAQAAVLEAAILVSRLGILPEDKIDQEIAYLSIAIDKTAGEKERQAWRWLMDRIREFRRGEANEGDAA